MKHFIQSFGVALIGGVVLVAAQRADANLIQNGGFESGSFSGWIQGGNTVSDVIAAPNSLPYAPHSGNYQAWFGAPTGTSYISQNVATSVNESYNISFWLANGNPALTAAIPATFELDWGNTVLTSEGPTVAQSGYTFFTFTAPYLGTPSTNLKFQFSNPGPNTWFRLDDVKVTSQLTVPDQGSGLLLTSAALLGLFIFGRGWHRLQPVS